MLRWQCLLSLPKDADLLQTRWETSRKRLSSFPDRFWKWGNSEQDRRALLSLSLRGRDYHKPLPNGKETKSAPAGTCARGSSPVLAPMAVPGQEAHQRWEGASKEGAKSWRQGIAQHHQACSEHRHRPGGASRRGWHRRGLVQLLRTGRRTVNLESSYYMHMVVLYCSLSNTCWESPPPQAAGVLT